MSAQFDRRPISKGNRLGYQAPVDTELLRRELMGVFCERPVAKTADVVAELGGRYGLDVVKRELARMKEAGYLTRQSLQHPWRLAVGRIIGCFTNGIAS